MGYKLTVLLFATIWHLASGTPWLPESRPDRWWQDWHRSLLNQTHQHRNDIRVVFLGDSITVLWIVNGSAIWQEHYAPKGAYGYGIAGDRTEHVLWRLDNGELDQVHPKLVVLMIGKDRVY